MNNAKIVQVTVDPRSLWGEQNPEDLGINADAAVVSYQEILTGALAEAFDGAEVSVTMAPTDATRIYIEATNEQDCTGEEWMYDTVRDIQQRVFESGDWA